MRPIARLLLPALSIVLVGCGGGGSLPDSYSILNGQQIRKALEGQAGNVVVLNFWATWCVPCRQEFPALVALDEKYRRDGVRVIGVSVDDVADLEEKVRPFIRAVGAKFPIWIKATGDPMDFMEALNPQLSGAIPETMIYNRRGNVVEILAGEQTFEQFEAAIKPLL